ncbi:MAG: FkbM family methyltransferase [Proteobacteria bacterium]|nr:FkbM family methyltransferase [Pseudomonadota bacterium]
MEKVLKVVKSGLKWVARNVVFGTCAQLVKTGIAINFRTGRVYSVPSNMSPIDYFGLLRGTYEQAEIKILREHFKRAANIIEIGANIGVVTRAAITEKMADAESRYVAVEPNPKAIEALSRNIARCYDPKTTNSVFIEAAALSAPEDSGKTASFMMRDNLSSGLASHTTDKLGGTPTPVRLQSLSSLLDKYGMDRASLIIDAEGAEIDMVFNDKAGLARIDQIAIEVHDTKLTERKETPDDVLRELEKQGFRIGGRESNTYYLYRPGVLGL